MKKQLFQLAQLTLLTNLILSFNTIESKPIRKNQKQTNVIHLKNECHESITVFFYANQVDKTGKIACKTFIEIIPAFKSTTITPKDCVINRIEVRHTPEEQHEVSTTEDLSKNDQQQETWWLYRGPNIIVRDEAKASR